MGIFSKFPSFILATEDFLKNFKDFIYLFLEGKGRKKRGSKTSTWGCLSHVPYWGPGLQPRCPRLGFPLVHRPVGHWTTQSTELHQPGPQRIFITGCFTVFKPQLYNIFDFSYFSPSFFLPLLFFPEMTSITPYFSLHIILSISPFLHCVCIYIHVGSGVSHYLFLISYQRILKYIVPIYVFTP